MRKTYCVKFAWDYQIKNYFKKFFFIKMASDTNDSNPLACYVGKLSKEKKISKPSKNQTNIFW